MADKTLRELSRITGENVVTLRRRAERGELLGAYKPGKRWWRVREDAVEKMRSPKEST